MWPSSEEERNPLELWQSQRTWGYESWISEPSQLEFKGQDPREKGSIEKPGSQHLHRV